jgi:DNA polymerase-3 subunit delta'
MGSLLSSVVGQVIAIDTLRRALASDHVHHAYMFEGPDGVGKELAAFGLAQALVCERRGPGQPDACGTCRACARAVPRPEERRPVHPDVVVLERGLYEPTTIGRRTPETQDLSIDQVRTLVLARAAFPPHEGRAKVFIVRRADELSVSAANALLKTLEEPGDRTHFVLLSSVPDSMLPTIRSRTLRVRFGALPDDVIATLLRDRGIAQPESLARGAGGSMAAALLASDPEASARREEFVSRALAALDGRSLSQALELAEETKKVTKDVLVSQLESFALALGAEARSTAAAPGRAAETAAARHALALAALRQLDGNASAQLAFEAMMIRMRSA